MTTTYEKILLKGRDIREEYLADAALSPGHLVAVNSDNEVAKHALAGKRTRVLVASEDGLQGRTKATAYSAGELVSCHVLGPENVANLRVAAGAVAISKGDQLVSAGDGTVRKISAIQNGLLYSNVAESAEHENTTDAANFDKTYDIPANSLKAGDVIRVRAQVTVNDNNGTDTLTLLLTLDGTTIATTGAVDVADGDIGYFEADIVIRTIGASGTLVASGVQALGVPGTVTGKPFLLGSTAVDTTQALTVAVNADWSAAHADNEASLSLLTVELIRTSPEIPLFEAYNALDNSAGESEDFVQAWAL